MDLDTFSLQCFVAVVQTGSFTRASLQISRTQSAVSQQIAKLEDLCGVQLLKRGKNLELTNAGEIFFEHAKQILTLHKAAIASITNTMLTGTIRFGLPEDFATVFLSEVLVEFRQIHPGVVLNIECDLTLNLFERFKKQEFDMVLVKMHRPQSLPYGIEIWSEELAWVATKDYPATEALLNKLPLVLAPKPCVYRKTATYALDKAGINWHIALSSPSYTGTIAAVTAGIGITVLAKNMIPKHLRVLKNQILPVLANSHISLLQHTTNNVVIQSLADFVCKHLQH